MKKNILLMGITIHVAALSVCVADVHVFAADNAPGIAGISAVDKNSVSGRSSDKDNVNAKVTIHEENVSENEEVPTEILTLRESIVNAYFANQNRTALRLAVIDEKQLRDRGASRTYPELLKGIPSLYATSESGSYGDAKLNIRGFGQENISVLLNGIPISGLVSGGMYWNNWMGLADATWAVQVQKGVGASMLSDGSVGGSVNIITESPSEQFSVEIGSYANVYGKHSPSVSGLQGIGGGPFKEYIKISSGALPHGWSMNLMASYVGGKGYVESTSVSSYAYMLNIAKEFGTGHHLIFTALGSPERHEQRSSRLSSSDIDKYGRSYSRNWGYRDGKAFNLSKNDYFKPYFTLQHIWDGNRLSMKNSLYFAVGSGGGRWSETKGKSISSFMTEDGHIDWDMAIATNRNPDGSANNILSQYMAGNTQAGAIASLEYRLGRGWKIGVGVNAQLYRTWEREKIIDLLGADWWYEDYASKSLSGVAGRECVKKVGDYVRTDNGKRIYHGTAYLTVSYESEKVNADLGASVFGSSNQRWDKYNYVGKDIYSDIAHGVGASVKGGVLVKVARGHSFYANGGWYSRLPYSNVWFSSGNNQITRGVKNEKNILGELGWKYVWGSGKLDLTGYAAYWKNRSLMSGKYRQLDADETRYMVTGLDAFHYGLETSVFQRVGNWLEVNAFASIGDWRWTKDVSAIIYDDYSGVEMGRVNVYCDGLPVADAPQTQIGASAKFSMPAGFSAVADWQFNDRMYTDFDPLSRNNPDDRQYSYRIPGYHLLGATISWGKDWQRTSASGESGSIDRHLRKISLNVFLRGDNLLDTSYIERGKDGAAHDLATFRGYWGFGRMFSLGIRVKI